MKRHEILVELSELNLKFTLTGNYSTFYENDIPSTFTNVNVYLGEDTNGSDMTNILSEQTIDDLIERAIIGLDEHIMKTEMTDFSIEVHETSSRVVVVCAQNINDAFNAVKARYNSADIVLDHTNHQDTQFLQI